jgi:hypothetical protein
LVNSLPQELLRLWTQFLRIIAKVSEKVAPLSFASSEYKAYGKRSSLLLKAISGSDSF